MKTLKTVMIILLMFPLILILVACSGDDDTAETTPVVSIIEPTEQQTETEDETTPIPEPEQREQIGLPPELCRDIRLGFLGSAGNYFYEDVNTLLEDLVMRNWLQSSAFSPSTRNLTLSSFQSGESGVNAVIASFSDFAAIAESEGMYLTVLLSDEEDGEFVGLFVRDTLRDNITLSRTLAMAIQNISTVDNSFLLTRDSSRLRAAGVDLICPNCVDPDPPPSQPSNAEIISMYPDRAFFMSDDIIISAHASLPSGYDSQLTVYWYEVINENERLRIGEGENFTFANVQEGEYSLEAEFRTVVFRDGIPRSSFPIVIAVPLTVLHFEFPIVLQPLRLSTEGISGEDDGINTFPWGIAFGAYAGVETVNIFADVSSLNHGELIVEWFARQTSSDSAPASNISALLMTGDMQGFTPIDRIGEVLSIQTDPSIDPRMFITTNHFGTFEYIARVTNVSEGYPTVSQWSTIVNITFRDETAPPYEIRNIFFNPNVTEFEVVNHTGLPREYRGDQLVRLQEIAAEIAGFGDSVEHIRIDGMFNRVTRDNDPAGYSIRRANTVADELERLLRNYGMSVPIHRTANLDQIGRDFEQRRAIITVSLIVD